MAGRWRRAATASENTQPMADIGRAGDQWAGWRYLGHNSPGTAAYSAPGADVSPRPDPPMRDLPGPAAHRAGRRRHPQLHAPLGDPPWGRPDTEATQLIGAAGPLCRAHQAPGCTACAWPARW
jgi:hypothetical protein